MVYHNLKGSSHFRSHIRTHQPIISTTAALIKGIRACKVRHTASPSLSISNPTHLAHKSDSRRRTRSHQARVGRDSSVIQGRGLVCKTQQCRQATLYSYARLGSPLRADGMSQAGCKPSLCRQTVRLSRHYAATGRKPGGAYFGDQLSEEVRAAFAYSAPMLTSGLAT